MYSHHFCDRLRGAIISMVIALRVWPSFLEHYALLCEGGSIISFSFNWLALLSAVDFNGSTLLALLTRSVDMAPSIYLGVSVRGYQYK